ncbi:hypothetical protein SELMODRAFT_420045 [Selaginella moellendorffii]|uniref:Uncharacterized protein n=1 Tax=Selaginella moellendorffii TaxID=88036 RepID=D8SAD3_SELML|nr:hypothetical protein SELMODRAFT_420045 [Selaginella moellendorffii]
MKERRENLDILKPEIIDMVVKKMKHNTYLSLEFFTLAMRISSFRHDVVMVMILGVDGNYFMAITDMPRGNDLYVKTKYDRKLRPSPRPRQQKVPEAGLDRFSMVAVQHQLGRKTYTADEQEGNYVDLIMSHKQYRQELHLHRGKKQWNVRAVRDKFLVYETLPPASDTGDDPLVLCGRDKIAIVQPLSVTVNNQAKNVSWNSLGLQECKEERENYMVPSSKEGQPGLVPGKGALVFHKTVKKGGGSWSSKTVAKLDNRLKTGITHPYQLCVVLKKLNDASLSLKIFTWAKTMQHDLVMIMILHNYLMVITELPRDDDLYVKTKHGRKLGPPPCPRLSREQEFADHQAGFSVAALHHQLGKKTYTAEEQESNCVDPILSHKEYGRKLHLHSGKEQWNVHAVEDKFLDYETVSDTDDDPPEVCSRTKFVSGQPLSVTVDNRATKVSSSWNSFPVWSLREGTEETGNYMVLSSKVVLPGLLPGKGALVSDALCEILKEGGGSWRSEIVEKLDRLKRGKTHPHQELGLCIDTFAVNNMIPCYTRVNRIQEAVDLYRKIPYFSDNCIPGLLVDWCSTGLQGNNKVAVPDSGTLVLNAFYEAMEEGGGSWDFETAENLDRLKRGINMVLKKLQHDASLALELFILAKTIPGFQHDLANYSTMIMILGNAGNYLMAKALFTEIQELGLCIDMVAANNIIRCYTSVIQDALDLQIGKLCGTIGIAVAGKHGSFVVFFDSLVTEISSDQIGQLYLEEKDREYRKVTVIRDEPELQIGIAGSVSDARCIIMVLKIEMSSQAQHGVTMTCEAAANFVFQRCMADEHCTRSSFFIFDNKKLFAVKRDNTRQYQLLQLDAVEQPFLTIGSGGPHAEGQAHGKKATLGQITNLGLDALAEACDNDPHCGGDKYYAYSNVKSHFELLLLKFSKKNFSYQYARRKRPRAQKNVASLNGIVDHRLNSVTAFLPDTQCLPINIRQPEIS